MIQQYIIYALGAAIIALGLWVGVLVYTNNDLKGEIVKQHVLVGMYQEAVKQKDVLIADYIKKGEEQQSKLLLAQKDAQESRVKNEAALRRLASVRVPTDCGQQIEYLNAAGARLNNFWATGEMK